MGCCGYGSKGKLIISMTRLKHLKQKGSNILFVAQKLCSQNNGFFLGTKTSGFDCIVIPGASKTGGSEVIATKQCGRSKGIVTAQGGASATVCSKQIIYTICPEILWTIYKYMSICYIHFLIVYNLVSKNPTFSPFISDG